MGNRSEMVRLRRMSPRTGASSSITKIRHGTVQLTLRLGWMTTELHLQTFACKKCKKCFRKDTQEFEERYFAFLPFVTSFSLT